MSLFAESDPDPTGLGGRRGDADITVSVFVCALVELRISDHFAVAGDLRSAACTQHTEKAFALSGDECCIGRGIGKLHG